MSVQGTLNAVDRSIRSVFVGNIPYEATEEQLKDIFAEVGPVVSFRLVYDRETGKPKGYGFCEYKDQETALSAMRNLNGYELNGRSLRVDNAASEKNKEELKNLQAALGGPREESPYGQECDPEKAPEVISKAVASLPPEQMFELMRQMKMCIQNNPNEARNMLLQNPQLAYALLQAQVVMKIVEPQVAIAMLNRVNPALEPIMPGPEGDRPSDMPPRHMQMGGMGNPPMGPGGMAMGNNFGDNFGRMGPPGPGMGHPGGSMAPGPPMGGPGPMGMSHDMMRGGPGGPPLEPPMRGGPMEPMRGPEPPMREPLLRAPDMPMMGGPPDMGPQSRDFDMRGLNDRDMRMAGQPSGGMDPRDPRALNRDGPGGGRDPRDFRPDMPDPRGPPGGGGGDGRDPRMPVRDPRDSRGDGGGLGPGPGPVRDPRGGMEGRGPLLDPRGPPMEPRGPGMDPRGPGGPGMDPRRHGMDPRDMGPRDPRAGSGPGIGDSDLRGPGFDPRLRGSGGDPRNNTDGRPGNDPRLGRSGPEFDNRPSSGGFDPRLTPRADFDGRSPVYDARDPRAGRTGPAPQGSGSGRPAMPAGGGRGAENPPESEKTALIMQVLQLSDQQIAMLPPEQRQSILVLKEQIAKNQQH